jgi:calcineurin-like phosphoesterase family protein
MLTDWQNRFDRQIVREIFHQTDDMCHFTVKDEELEEKHVNFMIFHYPIMFWRRGCIHLHGHVHSGPFSTAKDKVPFHPMRYDIGVDNNDFFPISYHQLKVILTKNAMK